MRAAIFIDAGYLLKQLQEFRVTPDYKKLADFLLQPLRTKVDLDLLRCYFYYCPPYMSQIPSKDELRRMQVHEAFVEELENIPRWQFREGKLQKTREGDRDVFSQKRVDVKLSVDLVRHAAAGHIQHALVVAGDSDFIPAIMAAKEEGVTITLCCGKDRSTHRDLVKLVDEVRYIDWKKVPKASHPTSTDSQSTSDQPRMQSQPQTTKKKSSTRKRTTKKAATKN